MTHSEPDRLLLLAVAASLAIALFALDVALPLGVAAGLPYIALVLIGWLLPRRSDMWLLTASASVLILVGFALSDDGAPFWTAVANRALALLSIWVVALLILSAKNSREALQLNEEKRRAHYDGVPIPIYSWRRMNDDFILDEVNEAALVATEGNIAQMIGRPASEVCIDRPDILEDLEKCWNTRAKVSRSGEYVMMTTTKPRYRNAAYIFIPPDTVMSHVIDITDRVQAETALREANERLEKRVEERTHELRLMNRQLQVEMLGRRDVETVLRESEQRYRRLVEQAPEGVLVHDGSKILFANPAALRLFGAARAEEFVGRDPQIFILEENKAQFREGNERMLKEQIMSEPSETILLRLDNTPFDADRIAASIQWDGRPAIQVIIRDITGRKLAEAALREAKVRAERANASKSRFLAAASHDLRQPIQALNLFVHSLARKTAGQADVQELVRNIRLSGDVMSGLLDALLDISKLDAGVVEPEIEEFPIEAVLDDVQTTFSVPAREKGIEFRVVRSSAGVRSDPVLLERVVSNYVSNALRYIEAGRVVLGCRRRGNALRIEVWDTGPGIPEDEQARVYEEFYQLENPARDRSRGLGLGLAIVERTARLLGHDIGLRSIPGKGSVFWIELPMVPIESQAPMGFGDELSLANDSGADVVVIEDDAIVLEGIRQMLDDAGFDVVAARDPDEALARLRRGGVIPDVIVADHRLDASETGIRAIARLQQEFDTSIPGIIITGDTAPDRLREASEGGHLLLHKPVRAETLLRAVEELVPRREARMVS